ncbi:ABC transporter G family member 22-like isoform X1 [Senna tora]|uniref:ABC transporter G family member 22-like isoform X1 n=1 Tax=Senna tora TaxID=362788 RepID=A0A834XL30_9FABA|nr:ABC transporter G family member 22-like isoform X1 [Senna tora]
MEENESKSMKLPKTKMNGGEKSEKNINWRLIERLLILVSMLVFFVFAPMSPVDVKVLGGIGLVYLYCFISIPWGEISIHFREDKDNECEYTFKGVQGRSFLTLDVHMSDDPTLMKFKDVKATPRGRVAKCVWIDLHGYSHFSKLTSGDTCSTSQLGNFSIVVKFSTSKEKMSILEGDRVYLWFRDVSYKVVIRGMTSSVEKEILNGINGSVNQGEVMALMNPSGSGKTTLLNLLGGRFNYPTITGSTTQDL